MDNARWERIQAIFHDAAALSESAQQALLDRTCGDDADLKAELIGMLKADGRNSSMLDRGLPDVAYHAVGASLDSISIREVGPYRLKRILGEGGMGVVWLAEREDTGNLVAIKFLPHAGLSPARRERFAREIKTLAKLKHPFIARLYDAGTLADGTPWFVMEYVEGVSFIEYCRAEQRPWEERLRLFRKVCEAVQYAQGLAIVHRDLKPSNILVERDGTPRLLDFGIAKELQNPDDPGDRTRPGLRFLSPDYAAPEWVQNGTVGLYTDVYSLGVILFEMLAGRLPKHSTPGEQPAPEADDDPKRPSLALTRVSLLSKAAWSDMDVLCRKAMRTHPQGRYQSAEALLRDIDHYLKGEPLEARRDTVHYRLGKFVVRNRRSIVATAATAATIVSLSVIFAVRLAREQAHANRESAIAMAMNRFLSDDLLGRSDPFKGKGAQEAFADAVSQAASQIDVKFKNEPVVAARLHKTIATAFDRRSNFPPAREEYKRSNELFKRGEGPLSPDAIVTRLQQAAMEARSYEGGSLALAKSMLAEAESSISKIAKPREDLAVWDLVTRGTIAVIGNEPRAGRDSYAAALRKAEAIPGFDDVARRRIKMSLAHAYVRLGEGAKAEPVFRELIDAFSATDGPESPETLRLRIYLAQSLMTQGKYADAVKEANVAYPALVKRLGEDHEVTLTLLGTRAASEGSLGMWDEAIRDDLTVYHLALRKQGKAALFSVAPLSDAALSQCRAGRYAVGEVNARKAFLEAQASFGPRSGMTGGCSYALAVCLIGKNKLDEASELLGNIDVKAVSGMSGDSGSAVEAGIALAEGEIALRRGDYASARRYAETASATFENPTAAPADKRELLRLKKLIGSHPREAR